jgi:hypothetical protein
LRSPRPRERQAPGPTRRSPSSRGPAGGRPSVHGRTAWTGRRMDSGIARPRPKRTTRSGR